MIDVTFGAIRNRPEFAVLREYMEGLQRDSVAQSVRDEIGEVQ
jgi:hypothetical protein